jgi:hypothetical protein
VSEHNDYMIVEVSTKFVDSPEFIQYIVYRCCSERLDQFSGENLQVNFDR